MKKLIIAALLFSGVSLKAQHDISTDVLGFAFSKYGISYDYLLNEQNSFGVNINFTSKNMFSDMKNQYSFIDGDMDYSEMNIVPEYKSYLTPNKGNDGIYIGLYAKYRTSKSADNSFIITDVSNDDFDPTFPVHTTDVSTSGFALGAMAGYKWKTSGAMFVEVTGGIGKFLSTSVKYSNSKAEDLEKDDFEEDDYIPYVGNGLPIDFRINLKLGIRIGSAK
jgi:hypothetical protein